jgi:hypothetical protein
MVTEYIEREWGALIGRSITKVREITSWGRKPPVFRAPNVISRCLICLCWPSHPVLLGSMYKEIRTDVRVTKNTRQMFDILTRS